MLLIKVKHWHIIIPLLSLSFSNLKGILKLIAHHLSPDTPSSQISIQRKCQSFLPIISIVIFLFLFHYLCRRMTYNYVHLKDQNSLNRGHKANPTFFLMDNQSKIFKDTRGFITDTKRHERFHIFF